MNIIWANMLMNVSCVMFGRVVAKIILAGLIMEPKEMLSFTINEPEILHFHSARPLLLDGVGNNANSCGVVNVDGSCWLWMTKFFKDKPDDFGFLCIKEECIKLCFSSRGSHHFENCAQVT